MNAWAATDRFHSNFGVLASGCKLRNDGGGKGLGEVNRVEVKAGRCWAAGRCAHDSQQKGVEAQDAVRVSSDGRRLQSVYYISLAVAHCSRNTHKTRRGGGEGEGGQGRGQSCMSWQPHRQAFLAHMQEREI